jgi:hypothetical protein
VPIGVASHHGAQSFEQQKQSIPCAIPPATTVQSWNHEQKRQLRLATKRIFMNENNPRLQIGVYAIDGSAQIFVQHDADIVNRTLEDLHPSRIFAQEQITIADDDTEIAIVLPLLTRIDLMTDHLSVWDFPFVLGALVEVTEGEFIEGIRNLQGWAKSGSAGETSVYLEIEMLNGQRLFLCMQVVAGLSSARLGKIYSLLKERSLIFGLRTGGIGILNLSNLVCFKVHPEPLEGAVAAHDDARQSNRVSKQYQPGHATKLEKNHYKHIVE